MHPATMVAWHCDDCPRAAMAPPGCPGSDAKEIKKHKFHRWVRLHLMLSTNDDIEFGIGGLKVHGTQHGGFYLANVAMPHRVDNKGTSTRTALLVDVKLEGNREQLKTSALGRSILQAAGTLNK